MLTDLERKRLTELETDKSATKRYNDFAVKQKLKEWLSAADEVELILNHMDYKKLGKIITPDTFLSMARISEKALEVSGIPTFTGRDTVIVSGGPRERIKLKKGERTAPIPGVSDGLFTVRRATDEERAQVDQLRIHILNLMQRLGKDDLLDVMEEAEERLKCY